MQATFITDIHLKVKYMLNLPMKYYLINKADNFQPVFMAAVGYTCEALELHKLLIFFKTLHKSFPYIQ